MGGSYSIRPIREESLRKGWSLLTPFLCIGALLIISALMSLPYSYMLSAEHLRSCFNAMNTPTSSANFSIENILGRVPPPSFSSNPLQMPMDIMHPWAYAMISPGFLPNPLLNASLQLSTQFQLGMKRRRRHRTIFNEQQIQTLEKAFARTHYPDVALREKLAIECCLKEERVEVWFKNRRAKQRKQTKEVGGVKEEDGVAKQSDDSEAEISEDEEPKEKRMKKESPTKEKGV